MTLWYDEGHSFGLLRKALRADLQRFGFSASQAGFILNWCDPSSSEYLDHVDSWQRFLCSGVSSEIPDFQGSLQRDPFGRVLLYACDPYSVRMIHTCVRLFYKYHGTPRKETDFVATKQRLSKAPLITLDKLELEGVRQCLSGITPPDLNWVVGRFGPGATFEGFRSYEKWTRLGAIPDVCPNLFRPNPRDPWRPRYVDPEGCTKIAEVPKSIKSNRIVSSEPAMRMFAQLGVNDDIVPQLHFQFVGKVSLSSQEKHNRNLRRAGACSIDFSDASDHVRVDLVKRVLPQLWPVLAKVRSQYTQFPDGDVVRLTTFAPMGSGVCFSIMTLVILGICQYAWNNYVSDHPDKRKEVWFSVYGDDVIVHVLLYEYVMDLATRAGLVPNHAKSSQNLFYRESCGMELLGLTDVSSIYIRDPLDRLVADTVELVCQRLADRGFDDTATCVAAHAQCVQGLRYNRGLQRMEVSVRTLAARQKLQHLDGWSGLNRWFCRRTQGKTWDQRCEPGVVQEVWTKSAWRYRAADDYPYLTHWFIHQC